MPAVSPAPTAPSWLSWPPTRSATPSVRQASTNPYLTPQLRRRERNTPGNVVHTAEFVAQLRGVDYASFDQMIERNAAELFGW